VLSELADGLDHALASLAVAVEGWVSCGAGLGEGRERFLGV
jgi:hypothetical protein